jgi:D-apionolactonase
MRDAPDVHAIRCGRLDAPPQVIELRAGPLALLFDPGTAFLRRIRVGDREVLRNIYVAVRDRSWRTVPPKLSGLNLSPAEDGFNLEFDVECREREIGFSWHGRIQGKQDGTVAFTMDGEALTTFLRNRIGFCVLHPIRECTGRPCSVEKVDGTREEGVFPGRIAPHQPFKNIRAISYEIHPGLLAEVRMEGETFEMEDQRNWSDASYKTYCTPLALPMPVKVAAGTRIRQSVTLTLAGIPPDDLAIAAAPSATVRIALTEQPPVKLPALGLGMAIDQGAHGDAETSRLRALNLSHLRVDLHPFDPDCADHFQDGHVLADRLGVPLEAAVHLSDRADAELAAVSSECRRLKVTVARWLIFHRKEKSTSRPWIELARRRLGSVCPGALMGAGTDGYFVEVNRIRPPASVLDLVCYSVVPQVHATDNATMVENLVSQSWIMRNAREFTDRPVAVSPVTLKSRKHSNGLDQQFSLQAGRLPDGVDARQMSLFGAGWTLGSLKYHCESGAFSLTYYETIGWRGVMEAGRGSPLPGLFMSIPGAVFPLYHVLADFGEFAGGEALPSLSSAPERVESLVLSKGRKTRILVANLGPASETAQIAAPWLQGEASVRYLDEHNAVDAMRNPESFRSDPGTHVKPERGIVELSLLPYGLARIDSAGSQV